jgi:spore germination protein YaaH
MASKKAIKTTVQQTTTQQPQTGTSDTTTSDTTTSDTTTSDNTQMGLRLDDLVKLVEMIEIAYKRGTYSKFEVEAVQQSFNRASEFIKSIAQKNAPEGAVSGSEQPSTAE